MRIGINISDELIKNLEPIKAITNISQICRQAIKDRVDAFQRASERAQSDGMDEAAARLIADHSNQYVDWEALALEDAKLWVQVATLEDFDDLFENLKIKESKGTTDNWIPVSRNLPGTKTFLDRHMENKEWLVRQIRLDRTANHFEAAQTIYSRSWLMYVSAVWQMVKDGIEAEAKVRGEELTKARADLDVPAHLIDPMQDTSV